VKLRIATRGSRLSLLQTELFAGSLKEVEPDLEFEIVVVKTVGDLVQDRPLYAINVKGVFEKEVNLAVLRGQADIAVHSLKDLPSEIHEELTVAGIRGEIRRTMWSRAWRGTAYRTCPEAPRSARRA
jgi:hydroxymethylbilane synthase (EC 2.5.1.61)